MLKLNTLLYKCICIQIHIRRSFIDKKNFTLPQNRSTLEDSHKVQPMHE